MLFARIASILLFLTCLLLVKAQKTLVLNTPSGYMRGIEVQYPKYNTSVYQFRKIPYAKPPIGEGRFARSLPIEPWKGVLDATKFGPSCIQDISITTQPLPNRNISEDCLLLNVYMPINTTAQDRKPVMIYIHGGSFVFGQGMLYKAEYLAITGDVIVVTINYRLGIFGFMSTGDSECPGNFGLYDQRLAMVWVKDNIKAFGGDYDMITIFGESAGGFSVGLHTLSPGNAGLFKRAMAHSGTGNSYFATTKAAKLAQVGIGTILGCIDFDNSQTFLKCMRAKPATDILNITNEAIIWVFDHVNLHYLLATAPIVDGDLVLDEPSKLLADKNSIATKFFRTIDFVNGDVSSEGSLLITEPLLSFQKRLKFNINDSIPFSVLEHVIKAVSDDFLHLDVREKKRISEFYMSPNDKDNQSMSAVNMFSDLFFLAPAAISLNVHSDDNNDKASYQFSLPIQNQWGVGYPYPKWFKGAGHASELIYLFGIEKYPNITTNDVNLSEQMMTYWTNFARSGNPNLGKPVKVHWPTYDSTIRSFINLDVTNGVQQGIDLSGKRVRFWMDILDKP